MQGERWWRFIYPQKEWKGRHGVGGWGIAAPPPGVAVPPTLPWDLPSLPLRNHGTCGVAVLWRQKSPSFLFQLTWETEGCIDNANLLAQEILGRLTASTGHGTRGARQSVLINSMCQLDSWSNTISGCVCGLSDADPHQGAGSVWSAESLKRTERQRRANSLSAWAVTSIFSCPPAISRSSWLSGFQTQTLTRLAQVALESQACRLWITPLAFLALQLTDGRQFLASITKWANSDNKPLLIYLCIYR